MRIYLDNCCFNRPYDDQSQVAVSLEAQAKLAIQKQIMSGELEMVTSYVLIAENDANPSVSKRDGIKHFIDNHTTVYVSDKHESEVDAIADDIIQTGIKYADACHVACAVYAGCDVFLTTDKRLLKYKTDNIRLLNPLVFLAEQEDN